MQYSFRYCCCCCFISWLFKLHITYKYFLGKENVVYHSAYATYVSYTKYRHYIINNDYVAIRRSWYTRRTEVLSIRPSSKRKGESVSDPLESSFPKQICLFPIPRNMHEGKRRISQFAVVRFYIEHHLWHSSKMLFRSKRSRNCHIWPFNSQKW